jgi:hypothetical protein
MHVNMEASVVFPSAICLWGQTSNKVWNSGETADKDREGRK